MLTKPSLESQLRSQESLLHCLDSHLKAKPNNQRLLTQRSGAIERINELWAQLPCQCGSGYSREQCSAGAPAP